MQADGDDQGDGDDAYVRIDNSTVYINGELESDCYWTSFNRLSDWKMPEIVVQANGVTLTEGTDYAVKLVRVDWDNGNQVETEVEDVTSNGHYSFNIYDLRYDYPSVAYFCDFDMWDNSVDLSKVSLFKSDVKGVYSGDEVRPDYFIFVYNGEFRTVYLSQDDLFTLTFTQDGKEVKPIEPGAYVCTVTGDDETYLNSLSFNYTIVESGVDFLDSSWFWSPSGYRGAVYTGNPVEFDLSDITCRTFVDGDYQTINLKSTDYSVAYYYNSNGYYTKVDQPKDIGHYCLVITANDGSGFFNWNTFDLDVFDRNDISYSDVQIRWIVRTSDEDKNPVISVTGPDGTPWEEGKQYTVAYHDNWDDEPTATPPATAGMHFVVLTTISNDPQQETYATAWNYQIVESVDISDWKVLDSLVVNAGSEDPLDGWRLTAATPTGTTQTLTVGWDVKAEYYAASGAKADPSVAGSYTLKLVDAGREYVGTLSADLTVVSDGSSLVEAQRDGKLATTFGTLVYEKSYSKDDVSLVLQVDGKKLVAGTDYDTTLVSGQFGKEIESSESATGWLKIDGKGAYAGTVYVPFAALDKYDLSSYSLVGAAAVYTGSDNMNPIKGVYAISDGSKLDESLYELTFYTSDNYGDLTAPLSGAPTEAGSYVVTATPTAAGKQAGYKGYCGLRYQVSTVAEDVVAVELVVDYATGSIFYTTDTSKVTEKVGDGWVDCGVAFWTPASSDYPVYRLYDSKTAAYYYATNQDERDSKVKDGWTDEGIAFYYLDYSDNPVTAYRLHNWIIDVDYITTSAAERAMYMNAGWSQQGWGFYVAAPGSIVAADNVVDFGDISHAKVTSTSKITSDATTFNPVVSVQLAACEGADHKMVEGNDYAVEYYAASDIAFANPLSSAPTKAGSYIARVVAAGNSYHGYQDVEYTVTSSSSADIRTIPSVTVKSAAAGELTNAKVTVQKAADAAAVVTRGADGSYILEDDVAYTVKAEATGYEAGTFDIPASQSKPSAVEITLEPVSYSITYDLGEGALAQGASNPTSYTIESDDITFAAPVWEGHEFTGWLDANGSAVTSIAKGSTGNVELTAQWALTQYKIEYELGEATWANEPKVKTYTIDDSVTLPVADDVAAPVEEGYAFTFEGWYGKADFSGDAVTTVAAGSTGDKAFYAKWTKLPVETDRVKVDTATSTAVDFSDAVSAGAIDTSASTVSMTVTAESVDSALEDKVKSADTESGQEAAEAIAAAQAAGNAKAFEVSLKATETSTSEVTELSEPSDFGNQKVKLSFYVGHEYNGWNATVYHVHAVKDSDETELYDYDATVDDYGTVSVEVDRLSDFIVAMSPDTTALDEAIKAARANLASVTVSDAAASAVSKGTVFVSPAAQLAYATAIIAAQNAVTSATSSDDVQAAIDALAEATATFDAAKQTGTYVEPTPTITPSVEKVTMYRLYNPYSGEHFYTGSTAERDQVKAAGWNDEGTGWTAPKTSATPVYRLYNQYAGDHHYTTSKDERDQLVKLGWNDEGIGWYSDDAKTTPLFRQYNPYATSGSHNYTTSKSENDQLVKLGWKAEGEAWYGL